MCIEQFYCMKNNRTRFIHRPLYIGQAPVNIVFEQTETMKRRSFGKFCRDYAYKRKLNSVNDIGNARYESS